MKLIFKCVCTIFISVILLTNFVTAKSKVDLDNDISVFKNTIQLENIAKNTLFYTVNLPDEVIDDLLNMEIKPSTRFTLSIKSSAMEEIKRGFNVNSLNSGPVLPSNPPLGTTVTVKYEQSEFGMVYEYTNTWTYVTSPNGQNVWVLSTTKRFVRFDDGYYDEK